MRWDCDNAELNDELHGKHDAEEDERTHGADLRPEERAVWNDENPHREFDDEGEPAE